MQSLFLELTLLVSLAVIVYLMSAAIPRIEDKKEGDDGGSKRSSLPLDKLDEVLLKAKDKFLHKMKVLVMKADNLISKQLKSKKNL
ncbi:MAG: hypothetical protein UX77_C0003G0042 [Parcubacteria group bacterium GW2011_GWA1_47_11]|uniref:Uncharacterized protein n=1 Tax=Candidatus Colwellbacteria bacterium GWA2_46_10 TaxID=1797684 RepID=A0A1G1YW07_9BACT|nr:MAG: hypothetical protein UX29_C0001G0029 [Parcubacteria group bacterium GW2011_GWA2_46_10]KKU56164.1 MAG: hypothetical protein UX77_C0003G0042 [Parcubacteria group bacterium GW2011_GWA1_47_11]OGY56552.1 MAG: hypothetical protein A2119_01430 [Candidatus Colwellbacteria bacterium GWA2_46_10]